jgi:hypothetical protein
VHGRGRPDLNPPRLPANEHHSQTPRPDYCIYKQHKQGPAMDSHEIEDTSD